MGVIIYGRRFLPFAAFKCLTFALLVLHGRGEDSECAMLIGSLANDLPSLREPSEPKQRGGIL